MTNPLNNYDLADEIRFFAFVESEELLRLIDGRKSIILAGDSGSGRVLINGVLVDAGGCSLGRGLAVIPTMPLKLVAQKFHGVGIESRRDGFVLLPCCENEDGSRGSLTFDDAGRIIAPVKRSPR